MAADLLVYPIESVAMLRAVYPMLEEACQRISAREGREHFAPDVYARLVRGDARMTVIERSGEPVGLFVTAKGLDHNDLPTVLHIELAYVLPGQPDDVMWAGIAECQDQARDDKRTQLTFGTQRRGWMRLAPRYGYELKELIFSMQVK